MEEYRQNPQNKTEYAAKCVPELLKYSCPICNKRKVENVLFINKIYSLVITSRTSSQIVAGCKKCLKEEIKRATVFFVFLRLVERSAGFVPYAVCTYQQYS